jgi:ATP-dependent DNA helicase RecG
MQASIGIEHREYFRKAFLKPLLESGKIQMTQPDRPNSPNQKYVAAEA